MQKVIVFTFIIACFTTWVEAQPDTVILKTLITGNQTFEATQSVKMIPGFSYKASPGNTFTARIVDEGSYHEFGYPVTPDTTSSELQAVGGIGCIFDVSPTGAATCIIPIEVPPGINGMQPSLGIAYNSQTGNGIAGWGCNIAGISAITRAPKTMYHDFDAKGITYGKVDAFLLDGQRLIYDVYDDSQGVNEGNADAVYHLENDPLTKVTIQGSYTNSSLIPISPSSDDRWFKVERNGMTYYYGSTTNARQIYTKPLLILTNTYVNAWYLNRVEDVHGNYMEYTYVTDNKSLYLDEIEYGNNANNATSLQNTISFAYTNNRQDPIDYKMNGVAGTISKRLASITSKTGNAVFRTCSLSYNTTSDGSGTKYSRLTSVTVKNGANEALY